MSAPPRWLFYEQHHVTEAAVRQRRLDAIDRWWQQFAQLAEPLAGALAGGPHVSVAPLLGENLHAIDPELLWDLVPGPEGPVLTFSTGGHHELGPLVAEVMDRAPQLPRWHLTSQRPPSPLTHASERVRQLAGVDISAASARVLRGPYNNVVVEFIDLPGADESARLEAAILACESLLGERFLDRYIGEIRFADDDGKAGIPLEHLLPTVQRLVAEIRQALGSQPRHQCPTGSSWDLLERPPGTSPHGQDDLYVARTQARFVAEAVFGPAPFYSERYSGAGELFCYVKTAEVTQVPEEQVMESTPLEQALDALLIPEGAGVCLGGGFGVHHTYIELALSNLPRGIDLIRRELQARNVPSETWLLFHDADLAREWVGIGTNAPPPPQPTSASMASS